MRSLLLENYSLEIGAGLGALAGKVWRVGLMGESSRRRNVLYFLSALENTFNELSVDINYGKSVKAAQSVYNA